MPKLTFIIYNVRKDNQQRKHTHTQSLKPRSSPDTLYQNPNPLPHAHICRFWLVLLLDCVDRQPSRASACPPHLSVSASHSFAHLCPVKHHRSSYLGGRLTLAGREHHLLLFNKTEQLVHTEQSRTGHAGPIDLMGWHMSSTLLLRTFCASFKAVLIL